MAATIEATETYLKMAKTKSQIIKSINRMLGERAIITPAAVATPFPPVKLRKIDQLCPEIAASPVRTKSKSFSPIALAIKIGITPLLISATRTTRPPDGPKVLKAFVNPMFLLP